MFLHYNHKISKRLLKKLRSYSVKKIQYQVFSKMLESSEKIHIVFENERKSLESRKKGFTGHFLKKLYVNNF